VISKPRREFTAPSGRLPRQEATEKLHVGHVEPMPTTAKRYKRMDPSHALPQQQERKTLFHIDESGKVHQEHALSNI
jgi:hypothetical protein